MLGRGFVKSMTRLYFLKQFFSRLLSGCLIIASVFLDSAPALAASSANVFKPTVGNLSAPDVTTPNSRALKVKLFSTPASSIDLKNDSNIVLGAPVLEPAKEEKSWFDNLVDGVNGFGKGVADAAAYLTKPVVDFVLGGIHLAGQAFDGIKLGAVSIYENLAGRAKMFLDTGSLLPTIFYDKEGLLEHKDVITGKLGYEHPAVSFQQFLNYSKSKSLEELKHDAASGYDNSHAPGPNQKYRYVFDPQDPNRIIDMRHFFVVGSHTFKEDFGLVVEIVQLLGDQESAFHSQDFFSNALGAKFFRRFNPDADISEQLEKFFLK